jgi:hypothetical protein
VCADYDLCVYCDAIQDSFIMHTPGNAALLHDAAHPMAKIRTAEAAKALLSSPPPPPSPSNPAPQPSFPTFSSAFGSSPEPMATAPSTTGLTLHFGGPRR